MKKGLGCLIVGMGLIYLPVQIYGSWLLYNHVHATDLMWFIWWFTTPLLIILQIFSSIMGHVLKGEK